MLLIPTSLVIAITVAWGLDFAGKTSWFIVSDGSALVVNVIGNLLLIPSFGAKGAAISTGLFSMWIVLLIEAYASRRVYPVAYKFRKNFAAFAILISAAFINTFFKPLFGTLAALVGLGFIILLYKDLLKTAIKDGLNSFKSLFSKERFS